MEKEVLGWFINIQEFAVLFEKEERKTSEES